MTTTLYPPSIGTLSGAAELLTADLSLCIMREIPLTQGQVAIVDDEDFAWLTRWNWSAIRPGRSATWYAVRREYDRAIYLTTRNHGAARTVHMHRAIAEHAGIIETGSQFEIDHRDGNGLHNWRSNFRASTRLQNGANMRKRPGTSSRFKGVSFFRRDANWQAYIAPQRQRMHLGYFNSEVDAAMAYDRAALFFFGEFARTNFCYQRLTA